MTKYFSQVLSLICAFNFTLKAQTPSPLILGDSYKLLSGASNYTSFIASENVPYVIFEYNGHLEIEKYNNAKSRWESLAVGGVYSEGGWIAYHEVSAVAFLGQTPYIAEPTPKANLRKFESLGGGHWLDLLIFLPAIHGSWP